MKLLLDLLPVIVFFTAFRLAKAWPDVSLGLVAAWVGGSAAPAEDQGELAAVILASLCAIFATVCQIAYLLLRRRAVKPSVWISAALILVFGGLTVWLHNPWFIKWKPSILYWVFAATLLGGRWIWQRNLLGVLFSAELSLPPQAWDRLLYAWIGFFLVLGGANLLAAYTLTTSAWVNFKTFGLMGLTLAYAVLTSLYVARYLAPSAPVGEPLGGHGPPDATLTPPDPAAHGDG